MRQTLYLQSCGTFWTFGTFAYIRDRKRACVCAVAKPDRRENRDVPGSDQSLKSLMDEYLDSTREPVGSRNLFRETPDQSEQAEARSSRKRRDEVASLDSTAITLYLVFVAVLVVVALAVGLL